MVNQTLNVLRYRTNRIRGADSPVRMFRFKNGFKCPFRLVFLRDKPVRGKAGYL